MRLSRFIKSLVNSILFIINAILWIFDINSLGELATGIQAGKGQKEKFMYGISSLIQYISYATIIGLIITIWWWYKNELSIAERISGIHMSGGKPLMKQSNSSKNKNSNKDKKDNNEK